VHHLGIQPEAEGSSVRTRTREPRPAREGRPAEPTLAAIVRDQTGAAWSRARDLCTQGRVTVNGERCLDPALRVSPGSAVVVDERAPKLRSGALPRSALVFSDRDVVVVDKPVGMLSIAYEPGDKDTLVDCTRILLRRLGGRGLRPDLGVVHRLDKETSGLMVFARTLDAKRILETQFRAHDIERVYHAIAHGTVVAKHIETHLILDRGDGIRGSYGHFRRPRGGIPPEAKRSITHLRPIALLAGATLIECRLETGRQHQIRIHLSELGHPLVGERVYIRDYAGPKIDAARPMLHARALGFVHPRTGQRMSFEREAPEDFRAMIESLRPTRR
jgi:23S rRNA pseudouridine1911/1915/1917 synthase